MLGTRHHDQFLQEVHDNILREREVAKRTRLSRSTRWRMERLKLFPKRRRLSENAVGWLESEIDAWIESRAAVDGEVGP